MNHILPSYRADAFAEIAAQGYLSFFLSFFLSILHDPLARIMCRRARQRKD